VQDSERARIAIDRHTECFATQSAVMSPYVGPIPPVLKEIGVATPQRIECVDDRCLLVANHPHFLEM
jgi:hypothetical protein